MRSAHYSHSTFPRRRPNQVMEPVSPLHTMFDPPAGHKKPSVDAAEDHTTPTPQDQTPKNSDEAFGHADKVFTPTPKKSHEGVNMAYASMDTPMPMHHQHAHMPVPWLPPFSPYPYGAPMSPYGPMTPHGTPGVMYPGFSPGPYYPGMFPDMYQMAPQMMPPPQMAPPPAAAPAEPSTEAQAEEKERK